MKKNHIKIGHSYTCSDYPGIGVVVLGIDYYRRGHYKLNANGKLAPTVRPYYTTEKASGQKPRVLIAVPTSRDSWSLLRAPKDTEWTLDAVYTPQLGRPWDERALKYVKARQWPRLDSGNG